MAEFNPYKLEEEKWTPKNVYEILPPNAVSWSDYDFGQGTDNVDRDAAEKSFIDGFVDFFKDLFGVAGQILGGALELGGAILGGFVEGVISFVGGIANAIGSIFGGGPTESPYLPMFSPIKANLEAAIQPFQKKIDESLDKSRDLLAEQLVLSGQIAEQVDITRAAVEDAKAASERAGVAIGEAEAASDAAEAAREQLEAYNTALNERITTEFNSAVGRANTAVDKADTLAGELADFKARHQIEIDDAIGKAEQAVADLATLSPQVEDAIDKASKAFSDVSDLTSQVSEAQERADSAYTAAENVRNEVTPKIEDAQTKGESALAVADTAIDWLKNPVEIGTSLIAVDPETKRPYYAVRMELVDDNPPGTSGPTYMSPANVSTPGMPGPHVPVDPKIKYTVSFWAKANKAGSVFYGQMRSQEDSFFAPDGKNLAVGSISVSKPPQPSNRGEDGEYVHTKTSNSYFAQNLELQTKWTYYEHEIQFAEGVTAARVSGMFWSHSNGVPADQYISGLDIRPQIPTQASVDKAQNDAIKANADILVQQGLINEAQRVANLAQDNFNDNQKKWSDGVDVALATQETVNDNFKIWSDGATAAIEANTTALAILSNPQAGASLVVTDPTTKRPNWAEKLVEATAAENPDNLPDAYKAVPGTGSNNARDMFVNIDPTTEYMVSVWVKANKTGSNMTYDMRDQDGLLAFVGSRSVEGFPHTGDRFRPYWIDKVPTKWTQYKAVVTPRATARKVRFGIPYFNHSQGTVTDATQYIADFQIYPLVPSQAQVDEAQNEAISANTEALKALGKKVLGASLVPYKTPTTQEVEDYREGKLDYDPWAEPEYYNAGHTVNMSPGAGKRTPRAQADEGTTFFNGTPVSVDSTINYRVKFRTYAGASNSGMSISLVDQDGNHAVEKTPFASGGSGSDYLVHRYRLPYGWANHEGVVTLRSGVKEVKLGTFYWNTTSSTELNTTTTQRFLDLEIVPEIPSQAVVDELQDNAIRENTTVGKENKKAIDALTEGMDAYVAAADLIAAREEISAELEEQSLAREDLEKKLNEAIVEAVPRTIIYDSGKPQFNDHFESLERTRVVAKPGWVGQMVLDTTWYNGDKTNRTIRTFPVPGTNDNRVYNVPSASFGSAHPAYRIDYWVYQGKSVQHALSNSGAYLTGSTHRGNTWTQIATHTVKKTNGVVYFRWTTRLKKADRGRTYYFDVRVNGTSVIPKSFKGYGPMTSLGDGRATLTFSGTLNVPDNGKITVHTKSTGNATQAGVSSNKGIVSYLELE